MTSDAFAAGGDPRRLLAEARGLARRVRVAQRVTWLPLLVLAVVVLGAIPVYRYGREVLSDCRPVDDGQACRVWFQTASIYWWVGLAVAYVVIAAGYLRVARDRGLGGARVVPFVVAGIGLLGLFTAFHLVVANLLPDPGTEQPLPWVVLALFRLTDFAGSIGLALLVLAWLERHLALLLFVLVYLTAVVLAPLNAGWGGRWQFAPMLAIEGGVLLLGAAGFALAQRLRRTR